MISTETKFNFHRLSFDESTHITCPIFIIFISMFAILFSLGVMIMIHKHRDIHI